MRRENLKSILHDEYKHIDSAEIEIPKGYEPESVPQPVNIETKFGKYPAKQTSLTIKFSIIEPQGTIQRNIPCKRLCGLSKILRFYL